MTLVAKLKIEKICKFTCENFLLYSMYVHCPLYKNIVHVHVLVLNRIKISTHFMVWNYRFILLGALECTPMSSIITALHSAPSCGKELW